MPTMVAELYAALMTAGAEESKVREAATAVAKHDADIADIKARLVAVQWAIGYLVAAVTALVLKAFT